MTTAHSPQATKQMTTTSYRPTFIFYQIGSDPGPAVPVFVVTHLLTGALPASGKYSVHCLAVCLPFPSVPAHETLFVRFTDNYPMLLPMLILHSAFTPTDLIFKMNF